MNFKITLAYDGTGYSGFQRQSNANSVQEEVERALETIYGSKIQISGAGRTDSGVHARGQVISFSADGRVPASSLPYALKGLLPRDMAAWKSEEASHDFHARFTPSRKEYHYTIDNGPFPDVFTRRYAYHYPAPLNLKAMGEAARQLKGKHDFSAFRAASSKTQGSERFMEEAAVHLRGNTVTLIFRADGFLYKMVRIMVGTLLLVGEGRLTSRDVKEILASRRRKLAGPTAPPHGLCLEKVIY